MVCRLGTDVDTRKVGADGTLTMAKARAATKRRVKKDGEWQDADSWFSLVAFGREADKMADRGKKGGLCFISGEVYSEEWTDKDGNKRTTLEVKVDRFGSLEKREPREGGYGGGQSGGFGGGSGGSGYGSQKPAGRNVRQDDDVPF
tara:strand:+ start:1527 stop:1964 length:438 start_codon:yes stop_codon:yes gene_type:complete